MTTQDQSRAEFEAAWQRRAGVTKPPARFPNGGDYAYPAANTAWWAWQAARALPAGMEPVGYLIDWPDEPDLGHYFAEGASTTGRSQPLHTAAQVLAMGRVPACPLPCGWDGLHKIAVADGAYLARAEWPEDEEGVSVKRATVMRNIGYLIDVCRTMLAAAPRPPTAQEAATGPCGQCKDARQPCQCSLDTILKERGLVAVNRESFQHMVTKIAAASAPACWCAACDSATSPFGIPTRMNLCQKCGDKRCPRAQHHNSDCSAP